MEKPLKARDRKLLAGRTADRKHNSRAGFVFVFEAPGSTPSPLH